MRVGILQRDLGDLRLYVAGLPAVTEAAGAYPMKPICAAHPLDMAREPAGM
jgi:hypothetical protein